MDNRSNPSIALCKHPEYSWCLCWVSEWADVHLISVYDPFNPGPPLAIGESRMMLPGEFVDEYTLNRQFDLSCLLGRVLTFKHLNDIDILVKIYEVYRLSDGTQTLSLLRHGGHTASRAMALPAMVLDSNGLVGFDSPSTSMAVHICPHLIHLPPSVPPGMQKPWWWDRVQKAHAEFLVTYKGPEVQNG